MHKTFLLQQQQQKEGGGKKKGQWDPEGTVRIFRSGLSSGLKYKFLLSLEVCLLNTSLGSRRDAIRSGTYMTSSFLVRIWIFCVVRDWKMKIEWNFPRLEEDLGPLSTLVSS